MHASGNLRRAALIFSCAAWLAPLAAPAQEAGQLLAVQQRKFRPSHELTLAGMFEPQDAFSKGLAPELSYSFHLDDAFSWEVLRGGYVAQFDTGLRQQLERDFGVVPTANPTLQYYLSSSLLWAPLYGKFALRNTRLVHVEAFLTAGGAAGHYNDNANRFGPEIGAGVRVFLTQLVSVRFDFRDAVFIYRKANASGAPLNQAIFLSLGLSFSLSGAE